MLAEADSSCCRCWCDADVDVDVDADVNAKNVFDANADDADTKCMKCCQKQTKANRYKNYLQLEKELEFQACKQ